jgi:hypothetical protein
MVSGSLSNGLHYCYQLRRKAETAESAENAKSHKDLPYSFALLCVFFALFAVKISLRKSQ